MKEQDLYDPVRKWLHNFLKRKYPSAQLIRVEDTSRITVASFLQRNHLLKFLPIGDAFDIKVDITGAVLNKLQSKVKIYIAIVEIKSGTISLRNFSQLLGYSKVVLPKHSFIISPAGWSVSLQRLIRDYNRRDVLEYLPGKFITVGKWDLSSNSLRPGDLLIHGTL